MIKQACATLTLVAWCAVAYGQREGTIYLPPVEDTEEELGQLADDLTPADKLRQLLAEGNSELAQAIADHRAQRTFATKDRVYRLLAKLSEDVIEEIANLEGNEGRMRDSIRHMARKVSAVQENLGVRVEELDDMRDRAEREVSGLQDELRNLAREITQHPENETELRRQFRRKLVLAQRLSRQHAAYLSHRKLHMTFEEQLARVQSFLLQLDDNLDMLLGGLVEQKSLLVMRVQLLRDSAEVEQWLRDVGGKDESAVSVAARIIGLQKALDQFDAATDLIVKMNDVSDLIDMIPDLGALAAEEGDEGNPDSLSARQIEDRYIEHFLSK
jgi:hypothetical protein